MDETSKYLIHASITTDGVVERSDVVGAIFGQTEGLLGDDLDLRDLQQSSKVGRIDVQITSEGGQSFGHVTIASSLDKVETAILAASLETITRVGPCQAHVEVTDIEDVREAKRREIVDRAKELLAQSFNEDVMDSTEILEEVRESVRVENISEFAGLPAGPRVTDSDAIIVVEGRSDVLTLLKYGVKNAIAVEGTNVPDAVTDITQERTVTAFLDGDRGGELILRELSQVGDVDYVAFAPSGQAVEDLTRVDVMQALREKMPTDQVLAEDDVRTAVSEDDDTYPPTGSSRTDDDSDSTIPGDEAKANAASGDTVTETGAAVAESERRGAEATGTTNGELVDAPPDDREVVGETKDENIGEPSTEGVEESEAVDEPPAEKSDAEDDRATFSSHVEAVVDANSGTARFLDADLTVLTDVGAEKAFDALDDSREGPYAIVVDGTVDQRLVDAASQHGVEHVVGRSAGEFVKKPVGVRVRTAEQF